MAQACIAPVCPRKVSSSAPVWESHTLRLWPSEAATIQTPSGLIAHFEASAAFVSVFCSTPVWASHRFISPFNVIATAQVPDGSMAHPNGPNAYSSSSGSLSSITVGTCHSFSVWSSAAETAHCPLGLIAQSFTPSACPLKMKTSSPVSALHPLIVPSRDVESIHLPSGLIAHPVTMPTWPKVVKRSVLVRTSHTFSPRSLIETSHVPSGLIAQANTISSCSTSREGGS